MGAIQKLEGRPSNQIVPVTPVQVAPNLQSTSKESASKNDNERHIVNKGSIKGTRASTNTSKDSPTQLPSNRYLSLVKKSNETFNTRIEELREYRRLHGHLNVRVRVGDNASLYNWSWKIRNSYLKYCQGKEDMEIKLTKDRIDILKSIGFDFESSTSKDASSSNSNESVDKSRTKNTTLQVRKTTGDDFEEHVKESPLNISLGDNAPTKLKTKQKHATNATRADENFMHHVEELREYKRLHGHFNVQERKNTSLYKWLWKIRKSYPKYCQSEQNMGIKLTKDRIDMLESTGFDFESSASKDASSSNSNESVAQTRTKKATRQLRKNTGYDFEEHVKESPSSISPSISQDAPTQLETKQKHASNSTRAEENFIHHVEELRAYKRLHGHFNVQQRDNAFLYKWLCRIRKSYPNYCQGKKDMEIKLTKDRIDMLESAGFDFESSASKDTSSSNSNEPVGQTRTKKATRQFRKNIGDDFEEHMKESPSSNSTSKGTNSSQDAPTQLETKQKHATNAKGGLECFMQHIEELREYKRLHGHCSVQQRDNAFLYKWSCRIRMSYPKYCQGKKDTIIKLTKDRINMLESAGFDFEPSVSKEVASSNSNESIGQTRTKKATRKVEKNARDSFEVSKSRSNASDVQTRVEKKRVRKSSEDSLEASSNNLNESAAETSTKKASQQVNENAEDSFDASSNNSDEVAAETSAKKASRQVSENIEDSFEEDMGKLKQYTQQHGHCDVRRSDNYELYRWCQNVRSSYPKHFLGEKMNVQLCEIRIQALFLIGFNFAPLRSRHGTDNTVAEACERTAPKSATSPPSRREEISSERMSPKRRRKECVKRPPSESHSSPISPLLNTRLDYSVEHDRKQEGLRKRSSSASANSSFSQEQAGDSSNTLFVLDNLGGVKRPRRGDASFKARVEELTRYRKKNGHCDVKRLDDRSLYEWCQNVRSSYANYLEGDGKIEIQLTDERVQALQAIGFEIEKVIRK